jgi:hypothetical protein
MPKATTSRSSGERRVRPRARGARAERGAGAFAFAQFLKRSAFEDYRGRAASVEEAYAMIAACEAIRQALAEAGYAPR